MPLQRLVFWIVDPLDGTKEFVKRIGEFTVNIGLAHKHRAILAVIGVPVTGDLSMRPRASAPLLGIRQVTVLINKMDLAGYDEATFRQLVDEYSAFLETIGVQASTFIPVSGMEGDSIAGLSDHMPWYTGETVLQRLDAFENEPLPVEKPFRMPVQGVYRFTRDGDQRRTVAGTVETGMLRAGDRLRSGERQRGDGPLRHCG